MTTIKESRLRLGLTQKTMALYFGMTQPALAKIEGGVEGRKETKGHLAHLVAIELLNEHGLLDELVTRLKAT
jgi:predicted transcriptional regulator